MRPLIMIVIPSVLKPIVSKVIECLKQFGKSDDLYSLLEEYPIHPWESWTIEEKIIHAPGIYG